MQKTTLEQWRMFKARNALGASKEMLNVSAISDLTALWFDLPDIEVN